jgi:aromatic-L-amino-acid/L-tryptophan decarboxylase
MIVDRPEGGVNGAKVASTSNPLSLDPETMRSLGYRAVDALVERWATLAESPPWVGADREVLDALRPPGSPAPEAGLGAAETLEEALEQVLAPAARVDHPRFLAYIPSAPNWPSVLADFLASGFNIFQGTWQAAPAPSHAELEVLEWFRQWLELPQGSSGIFTSGGSAANTMAMVMARMEAEARHSGGAPFRPSVYLSDQGHSSLVRGARVAGISSEGIRLIPTGPDLKLRAEGVRRAVLADRAQGWTPILLAANGGATNTGIVDPLSELAAEARSLGIPFHVDAAYGGFGVLDPRGRAALEGIGEADSVTLDPHKWLFQPFECGCLMVRDPSRLVQAFRVEAEYLNDAQRGDPPVNFGDRGLQLTRAFRALKVWMSVRSFGLGAFREAVGKGMDLGFLAEARLRASPHLEVVVPASLGIVVWRARGGEAPTVRIRDELARSGEALLSSTRIRGDYALRFCLLNPATQPQDVEQIIARAEALASHGE